MKVWITQGEHFRIPGRHLKVSATEDRAITAAIGMVEIMLQDSDIDTQPLTRENWKAQVARLQERYGEDECDVWIEGHEVES